MAALALVSGAIAPVLAREARAAQVDVQAAVQAMLMNRHPNDTPAWWRGLGPGAPLILERMYERDESTYHRMRLLEGLSAFVDDPQALAFVQQQTERTDEQVIRNAGVRAIGKNQGAKAEEWLSKFLAHPDPHTRLAAAQALKGSPRVAAYLATEKTPWVVAGIKGEPPPVSAPLQPSGSSDDRLSADFVGRWRGHWMEASGSVGLKSVAIELELALDAGVLSGQLKHADKRVWTLSGSSGRSLKWSGTWVEVIAPGTPQEHKIFTPVEAELKRRSGELILEIHAPQSTGTAVLRRDGASQ